MEWVVEAMLLQCWLQAAPGVCRACEVCMMLWRCLLYVSRMCRFLTCCFLCFWKILSKLCTFAAMQGLSRWSFPPVTEHILWICCTSNAQAVLEDSLCYQAQDCHCPWSFCCLQCIIPVGLYLLHYFSCSGLPQLQIDFHLCPIDESRPTTRSMTDNDIKSIFW